MAQVREDISTSFPALAVASIEFIGEGMDSAAYLVNGEFVFRFPKHEEVVGQLGAEIALLPKLRSHVDVQIPDFELVGQQRANGYPFVGYRKIDGVGLEKDLLLRVDLPLRNALVKRIAEFLGELHRFSVDVAAECGVKLADFRQKHTDVLEQARRGAFPLLDGAVVDHVEALFQGYLSDDGNFAYEPVLLHADFSPDHIIYDIEKRAIAGVIDFGDIQIGDPDYDLMYLYEDYWGEPFIREFLAYYPHDDPERLMRKLDFFSRCNTVMDVLIGLRRDDEAVLQWALKKLKAEAEA